MRLAFLLAGLCSIVVLVGCVPDKLAELKISQYNGPKYTYKIITQKPPAFQQSTFAEDRLDSAKKWLSSSSFSPERIAGSDIQNFLNEKDPALKIAGHAQQTISDRLGWRVSNTGADFSVYTGTLLWGVRSNGGKYYLYYYSFLNIVDKKEHDAIFSSKKTAAQAKAAMDARTSAPINLECRYRSESIYSYNEITTNRTFLVEELSRAVQSCNDDFDKKLEQRTR